MAAFAAALLSHAPWRFLTPTLSTAVVPCCACAGTQGAALGKFDRSFTVLFPPYQLALESKNPRLVEVRGDCCCCALRIACSFACPHHAASDFQLPAFLSLRSCARSCRCRSLWTAWRSCSALDICTASSLAPCHPRARTDGCGLTRPRFQRTARIAPPVSSSAPTCPLPAARRTLADP